MILKNRFFFPYIRRDKRVFFNGKVPKYAFSGSWLTFQNDKEKPQHFESVIKLSYTLFLQI